MKRVKFTLTLALCSVVGGSAFAQGGNGEEESVGNVEINVYDRYEAKVREARKISQQPNYNDTTTHKLPVDYDFSPRIVETELELEPITPALLTRTKLPSYPENMVKFGFGNYITPELSLVLANSRSNALSWSVALDHFSTQTGALRDRSIYNDNFTMNNGLRGGIKHVGRKWRFKGDVDIDLRDISYYGVPKVAGVNESIADSDPMRQRYYTYGASTRYERVNNSGNDVFRGVGLKYHYMHDRYSAGEHFLKAMSDWTIPAGDVDLYLGAGFDYLNYSADSAGSSAYAVRLKPYIKREVNDIHFTVGLNINYVGNAAYSTESALSDTSSGFYVYPEVRAELPLVRDVLNIFGGWVGNVDLNGLSGISKMNPYVAPGVAVQETGVNKVYVGISGRISRRFGYNLQADYFRYANKALFYRDSNDYASGFNPYLRVGYENLDVVAPRAELTYHHPSGVEVSGDATYFLYNMEEGRVPYHLPDFKGAINVSYTWKEKIVMKTNFILTGPREGLRVSSGADEVTMPTFMDWRLYTEYKYNDYLSAYLSVNNILNQDYDLWYGYPAQGIRVILGFAMRF